MLESLDIKNIILIDNLHIDFEKVSPAIYGLLEKVIESILFVSGQGIEINDIAEKPQMNVDSVLVHDTILPIEKSRY